MVVAEPALAGRYIAVVGPADAATESDLGHAAAIGRGLAERGAIVLTGGMNGVMQAAARGAAEARGTSIGLLPGPDRSGAAPENTFILPTGLGEMRNALLVRAAEAVVAVGCSWGTLSEIALARRTGVPLVLLGGWDLPDDVGSVVSGPDEALAVVERLLG